MQDNEPDSPECDAYMYGGQEFFQKLFVIVAVVSAGKNTSI